jgi:hypothetical protein
MARVLIGTSGWHYDSWRGPFFPEGLPLKAQLQYYASQFSTAELNGVFYRTPTPEVVRSWYEQTGKDFVFAWKASKFITHWKRLSQNSVNSLELLEDRLSLLGNKAGPILFQVPPDFEADSTGLSRSSSSSQRGVVTVSSFGMPAGTRLAFCAYSPNRTSRSAFRTITMHRPPGGAPPISSTSEGTGPKATTEGATLPKRSRIGPNASGPGRSRAATYLSISTTTKRARRLLTPAA